MSKARVYEVRGQYTMTVAKAIYARSEEEAVQIFEDMEISVENYCSGDVGCYEAECIADGEIVNVEATTDFCYVDEDDADEEECKEYWNDYYDDEEDEEDE